MTPDVPIEATQSGVSFRWYRGGEDVALLQAFNAAAIRAAGHVGFLHPGEIPHRIFNSNRLADPCDLVGIWEDAGEVAGWLVIQPRGGGFDLQVRPDLRNSVAGLEAHMLRTSEELTWLRVADATTLGTEVFLDDTVRLGLMADLGWVRSDGDAYVVTFRSLGDIPEVLVPDGYRVRSVAGVEEADALAVVHAASFGSSWTGDTYRGVMEAPGYDVERELVVEAPDGSLAGFTVTWHDTLNSTGLFEPMGVHPDHRRRGIARALLASGMRRMAAAGLSSASVVHAADNPASGALYRGMGFQPTWRTVEYTRDRSRT